MTLDVLAIGETMVMVTPEQGGRLVADGRYLLHPGGAESNVAAHLARLGHTAAWGSALGADPLGDIALGSLMQAGVDISAVRRDPRRPTAVYFKDPTPEETTVFYYRKGSAASAMDPGDLPGWQSRHPRIVHLSGITPALSDSCAQLIDAIVVDRAIPGALISFDVNHRPSLWADGQAAEHLRRLALASDVVFVGRDEAERLWGTGSVESVRTLLDRVPILVVKDGAKEAVSFEAGACHRVPSLRVPVLDAVGAGDAFAAGWLSGHLRGRDPRTRLRMGHYVASRVLMSPTDSAPLPPSEEVATLVADTVDFPKAAFQ